MLYGYKLGVVRDQHKQVGDLKLPFRCSGFKFFSKDTSSIIGVDMAELGLLLFSLYRAEYVPFV